MIETEGKFFTETSHQMGEVDLLIFFFSHLISHAFHFKHNRCSQSIPKHGKPLFPGNITA